MREDIQVGYNQKVYYLNDNNQIVEGKVTSSRNNNKELEIANNTSRVWKYKTDVVLDKQVLIDFIDDNGFRI
jgi:hypothetical protein